MKSFLIFITLALVAMLVFGTVATARRQQEQDDPQEENRRLERTAGATENVIVTLSLDSGDVVVRGWNKREVRASANGADDLELQTAGGAQGAATRIAVVLSNGPKDKGKEKGKFDRRASGDVTLDVPRGATVQIQTRNGDVDISDVADLSVETWSGDVSVQGVSRAVEVKTLNGSISLEDSKGHVRLYSVSGDISAANIGTVEPGDSLEAKTTSGEVTLERIAQARVVAGTTSGNVSLEGALARGGSYELSSYSGDVTLEMPGNSSFRVTAVAPRGEITTDFEIKNKTEEDPLKVLEEEGRLSGNVGSGDATLNLTSFSGTIRLRRQ